MKNIWTLTLFRMRLALRNRVFIFFSVVMPLAYMFLYVGIFGRGSAQAVSYMLSPVLALTVMGSFWGLSMQLVTFREQGILRRFRLAPVGAGALLASGLLSNYFLVLPTIVLELIFARWFFRMEHFGNLWGVLLLITLGTFTFAALGLTIASVTSTMQETQAINNVIWMSFLFLSGATLPFPLLPRVVQSVAAFLPPTYLVSGLHQALLLNAPLSRITSELVVLGVATAAAFVISVQLFRWEPEAPIRPRARLLAAVAVIPFLLLGIYENATGRRRQAANELFQQIQRPASDQAR